MSEQRAALVTGGSRGIGRGICLELGRLNYAVVVNYATRPDAAEQVVAEITDAGGARRRRQRRRGLGRRSGRVGTSGHG